ncbi:MAG: hypothetical protein NTU78_12255, partial [Alphaproteobacteria bacterium]|nr:hypothetical protein [Alphaproteobacteria bacterium]
MLVRSSLAKQHAIAGPDSKETMPLRSEDLRNRAVVISPTRGSAGRSRQRPGGGEMMLRLDES